MDDKAQRKVYWAIGIGMALLLASSSGLNPFKQTNPDWQVIKEKVSATVFCNDWEYDGNGEITIGYAPCVRLTNVTYDSTAGDQYCYSADVEIGGYQGENYETIGSWNLYGKEYYCVSWREKYIESDVDNPEDWSIDFGSNSPANLV
jgi:hypothetical protein